MLVDHTQMEQEGTAVAEEQANFNDFLRDSGPHDSGVATSDVGDEDKSCQAQGKDPWAIERNLLSEKGGGDEPGRGILVEQLQRWTKRRLASKDKKAKGEINRDFLDNTKKMCIFANSI